MPPSLLQGRGWTSRREAGRTIVALAGDWNAERDGIEPASSALILALGGGSIGFDSVLLTDWDSGLIVFLFALREGAVKRGIAVDQTGLPPAAQSLLTLIKPSKPAIESPKLPGRTARLGQAGLDFAAASLDIIGLIGSALLRGLAALAGRSSMRRADLIDTLLAAGLQALPIVTLINLLFGGILAFVGAIQLRRFGADLYVASLVGITMVREMAAIMTAIIMAGRTGGAYAAHLATMQGNEEIDALSAFGIPIFDYLVLPRLIALTLMMPILYLWGCAVSIAGGLLVSAMILNIAPSSFLNETRLAVQGSQFVFGLVKSVSFGALIALIGCHVGLRAGRSAADVGRAATSAVVASVVGIIALDALFDVGADILAI